MLRNLARLSAVLLVACLLSGCATTGLHQTARTTPWGKFEFGGVVTPVFVPFVPGNDIFSGELFYFAPVYELSARLGLSDNSDLGLRGSFAANSSYGVGSIPGLCLDYKQQLASGEVDVAGLLGGSLYAALGAGQSGGGYFTLSPRLVVSREDDGLPWAFNAGIDYYRLFVTGDYGAGSGAGLLSLRAGFGLPFRAFESVRIMPEVAINLPLYAGSGYESELTIGQAGLLTLGVSLGSVARGDGDVEGGLR